MTETIADKRTPIKFFLTQHLNRESQVHNSAGFFFICAKATGNVGTCCLLKLPQLCFIATEWGGWPTYMALLSCESPVKVIPTETGVRGTPPESPTEAQSRAAWRQAIIFPPADSASHQWSLKKVDHGCQRDLLFGGDLSSRPSKQDSQRSPTPLSPYPPKNWFPEL